MTASLLVVGLGNPDRGDDGVGALVVERLKGRLPAGVKLHMQPADMLGLIDLWAGFDAAVCVDASAPQGEPGRIRRLDLATDELPPEVAAVSSHTFGFADTVALARALYLLPRRMIVFAIEGLSFDAGAPMTPAVVSAVRRAADLVGKEAETLLGLAGAELALPR